ncbi:acetyl-CoA carboxylase biotin carboxylase subunit family protein [Streptomyces leeuwenhoekii]|uniref:ATP-grasp domain-containing protein n=1 Tax=Streptomyces leeuwenhoekii TaxID=1437453 RepID=UPI0036B52712
MARPLLLLGLGGPAAYSEFLLAQIAASCPVILVDTTAPAWARPYLARHLPVNPADEAAAAAMVLDYASHHELGGVLTLCREHLVTAARFAQWLGLGEGTAQALSICADRFTVRQVLAHRKVPLPRWAQARDPEAAAEQAGLIGYPVVIKARSAPFTSLARSSGEVPVICARVEHNASPEHGCWADGLLVEERLDGLQVAAETVVLGDGDIQIVAITRTVLGAPPALQTMRHCVYAHDSLLHNRILRQTVARAVEALGVRLGVLHVEMTLTSRGPRITDISAHLPGDLIPLLVERATGVSLARAAADLATGRPVNLTPTRQRAAAVHFAYATVAGRIDHLDVATRDCSPLVDRVVLTQQVGQHVAAAGQARVVDRLAHWVVLGLTAADCHTALDRLTQDLSIHVTSPATAVAHAP